MTDAGEKVAFFADHAGEPAADAGAATASKSPPRLQRGDWAAFWIAGTISFVVYFCSLASTVSLEDSGILAVAADHLGVPHPPGYPLWTIIGWFFSKLFFFKKTPPLLAQPNPAWGIGLMSAVFGALTVAVMALLICRSGRDLLGAARTRQPGKRDLQEDMICAAGGIAGSLLFGFSPGLWSKSVIVEVLTLQAFLQALILMLAYAWFLRPSDRLVFCIAILLGLGLGNTANVPSLSMLPLLCPLALVVLLKDRKLFRDFFVTGLVLAAVPACNAMLCSLAGDFAYRFHKTALTEWAFRHRWMLWSEAEPNWGPLLVMVAISAAALIGARIVLPRGRTVTAFFFLVAVGSVLVRLYIPIAANSNPPINWGYARTWEGLVRMTIGGCYERFSFQDFVSTRYLHQIGGYFATLREQFTLPVTILGFLPFACWSFFLRGKRVSALLFASSLALLAVTLIIAERAGFPVAVAGSKAHFSCIAAILVLLGCVAGLAASPLRIRSDLSLDARKWVLVTVAAFLLVSYQRIAGIYPGGLQDMFYQRSSFWKSHEIFSLWIGYGLILGLGLLSRLARGNSRAVLTSCILAMLLPAYAVVQNAPIVENQLNRDMIRTYGGASQRNHDFGWQFGNYSLRGVEAIIEELKPGEEPPPSRTYPPPMTSGAVLFGGSDPGRFVNTYMVFSADVRSDVFVLTQNALADNTYVSQIRDLYGDRLWVPSVADNNEAFRIYRDQFKAGRQQPSIGRSIFTGVEHVMAINGILCKMIHDNNKWKHDFYVEESYVVPWMYPYMQPNGLILRLNNEELPGLSPEMIKNDMEFWAWYSKKLMNTRHFLHDVVARNTFSKLRCAIAGLYEYREMYEQAEQAYKEAILLCPTSPQGSFRLANMFMWLGRLDDARKVLGTFRKLDPNDTRIDDMLRDTDKREGLLRRKDELEQTIQSGKVQLTIGFELADVYRSLGNSDAFRDILQNMMQNDNLTPDAYVAAGKMFFDVRMFDDMDAVFRQFKEKVPPDIPPDSYKKIAEMYAGADRLAPACEFLQAYLAKMPMDARAWHELGVMCAYQDKHDDAIKALREAIRSGGADEEDYINRDARLEAILGRAEYSQFRGSLK